jgi:penicillin-binding protein 1C
MLFGVAALFVLGPLPAAPETRLAADATRVEDRDGRVLYASAQNGSRRLVPLAEIAPTLQAAVIATEDARFYQHPGVDPLAIVRATLDNLRAGRPISGAGTITQQLARNLYGNAECGMRNAELCPAGASHPAFRIPHSALARKARETVLALRLSRRRSKDDVLALYLNHAYFGNLAYGAEAAARTYFGRPARDLDLAESAMLAGLIQAPATYDPLLHPEAARARQSEVLRLMVDAGAITPDQADAARAEPLAFAATPFPISAPHFVTWVLAQAEAELGPGAAHGGLRVITTLDLGLQRTAEETVARRLATLKDKDVSNAAVVALDPTNGHIVAMVGSADYFNRSIDGAVNLALAPRQPGSAMKPLLYGLALEGEITAATPLIDVDTPFTTRAGELYQPNNYDRRFHGMVPVREALAGSYNVPAVRLLSQIGVGRFLAVTAAAGITTLGEPERLDLAVVLGGGETPLLELTGAYLALANGGERRPLVSILRIEDAQGRVLWRPPAASPTRVFSPEAAWLVTDILADNQARTPAFGATSALRVNRPAAVKTGTTSNFRDNWTIGYTPDLVIGVWVGNADNSPMRDVSGVTGAAPIWHDLIEDALTGRPPRPFARPEGLTRAEVCLPSGARPTEYCARRRFEWFKAGTEPNSDDTYYRPLLVCAATGRPVTSTCPDGRTITRVFEFPPAEVIPWAQANGVRLAPECGMRNAECGITDWLGESVAISQSAIRNPQLIRPAPGLTVRISRSLPESVQALPVEVLVVGPPPDAVRIEWNGVPMALLTDAPHKLMWPLVVGTHRFRAVAVQGGQETPSDEVQITVLPPSGPP